MTQKFLSELKKGEKAVVISLLENTAVSIKLIDLGLLPGEVVCVERIAPFGDPMVVSFSESLVSLRSEEAKTVLVERI